MIKKSLFILIVIIFSYNIYAQDKKGKEDRSIIEDRIINHFRNDQQNIRKPTRDSLYTDMFTKNAFNIAIGDTLMDMDTIHLILRNPYYSEKYDDSDERDEWKKNFPRSFSVVHQNCLITLFESGKFSCFKLEKFDRDENLERQLNTKKFKYHWIINNQLAALCGNKIYLWNGKEWIADKSTFPLKNKPKLFEDDEFIVYSDCYGEWGGTVYFYEKSTSKTFFTESTCAKAIIKQSKGYHVTASLGHGHGSSEIKVIGDPRKLTFAKRDEIGKMVKAGSLGYTDTSGAFEKSLDLYGIQIFSSFVYGNRELHIVHVADFTFIAEITGNNIKVVHPLFFSDLYTHRPLTTQHKDFTLINLDHYGTGREREISLLLISKGKIVKVDWNERHN